MAYSNWGGYGYRNGIRQPSRSDASVMPDGTVWQDTSAWPPFADLVAQYGEDEAWRRTSGPGGHVVLGDGPFFVHMYKLYLEYSIGNRSRPGNPSGNGLQDDRPIIFKKHRITGRSVQFRHGFEMQELMTVHVLQPNGVHWHGWVTCSAGAGFEERYPTETQRADRAMKRAHAAQWKHWGPY